MVKSIFSTSYDRFRDLLINARRKSGMTQVEMAKKLRKPQSYISKYERGERRLDVIEFLEISKTLGLNPTSLLKQIGENHA